MSRPGHPLREAMITLAREELRGVDHPSTSRLIAYHRGELQPAEMAVVREHLSLCAECSTLVLDAAEFFTEDDEEDAAAPSDLEAAWQELRLRAALPETPGVEQRPPSPAPAFPSPTSPRRSLVRSLSFAYGLAAAFAALSVGLVVFRETSPPLRPQANTGLYDLTSSGSERGSERGGAAEATPIRFRTPGDSALLILNPEVVADSARHGVRIHDVDGVVVWQSEDLVPQPLGGFHLSLPADALPPGRYSLKLYGVTENRETPLGTYLMAIEQ